MYRANSTAGIIYNLQFEESNFWFDIYSFISLLLFNKNKTFGCQNGHIKSLILATISDIFPKKEKPANQFTDRVEYARWLMESNALLNTTTYGRK